MTHLIEAQARPPLLRRACIEWPQVQRGVVERALGLWVRREEDLEPTIQAKAVHDVSAHAAADAVGRLQQRHVHSRRGQRRAAAQPGHACGAPGATLAV